MKNKLRKMRILARKISDQRKAEEDTVAVLLFGSVAKGNIHPSSDIDIVIIKDSQDSLIERKEYHQDKTKIDLWKHSCSFYNRLFKKNWQPAEMFLYSLFLNILQDCNVLYDGDTKFGEYRENALKWIWPKACKDFIMNKLRGAVNNYEKDFNEFEKLVYLRKMFLLQMCRRLLDMGKPVSIRNKDYYLKCKEHFSIQNFETVFGRTPEIEQIESLFEKTVETFNQEVKDREPWTELKDARSYLSNNRVLMATISLQNGAYYLGCEGLANRKIKKENKGFLYPESEIELIQRSWEHWKEFHDIYRTAHNVDAWPETDIDSALNPLLRKLKT